MRSSWAVIALGTLVLGAGCGGGSPAVPADAGPPPGACVRLPALLEARSACRQDDQCPCGTYCARGVCVYDCRQDADCQGWCDPGGQCRDAADRSTVPAVRSGHDVPFRVHPAHLPVIARDAALVVTLGAPQQALGPVRLEASAGLLIECGGATGPTCELDGVPAGGAVEIRLAVDPADRTGSAWRLAVFHGLQMQTVSFAAVAWPAAGAVRGGVYRGTVWTEGAAATLLGSEPAGAQPVADQGALLTMPLEARVFDDGTLVLLDPRGVFPGVWKFQLGADGQFGNALTGADGARRVFLGHATAPTDATATEVTIDGAGALEAAAADALTGTLTTTLGGLGLGHLPADGLDERPRVRWGLSLVRVGDLAAGDAPGDHVTTDPVPVFAADADRYGHALPWEATLAGVTLRDPANAAFPSWAERMQYFLCYQRGGGAPTSSAFGAEAKTRLLDYACATPPADTRIEAFPFFALDGARTADTLLQDCVGDLARVGAAPPTGSCGPDDIDCLTGDTLPRTCVDAPLVLSALGMGLEQLGRVDWPAQPYYEARSDTALKLAHRLLQQWLQLHTFLAREAAQASDLSFGAPAPDPVPALAASLDGWHVVLHPKAAGRLMHWPAALLAAPDYRAGQTLVTLDSPQAIGVPVLMLEALTAQVEAATQLVVQTRLTVRPAVPGEVARTLRAVVAVAPLARLLYRRAAVAGDPPWAPFWADAERRLAAAVAGLQGEWEGLEQGANPLGIEEADLPLYHSGADAADAIDRFKAISSYLLAPGGGASDAGWATRAVADALTSAAAAQGEWEQLLQRRVQLTLGEQDRADRLTQIRQNYGEKLLTLCGEKMLPTPVAAVDVLEALAQHPEVSAFNCFLDQQDAACRFDEAELRAALTADDLAYRMCVLGGLQQQFDGKVQFKQDFANDFVAQARDLVGAGATVGKLGQAATLGLYQMGAGIVAAIQDEDYDLDDIATDVALTVRTRNPNDLLQAETLCRAAFPQAVPMNQRVAGLASSPLDRPDCYHGSMGELALAVRAAAKDVAVATARFQELTDKYTIALDHCLAQESALSQQQEVLDAAGRITEKVARLQPVADGISSLLDGAIGCCTGSGIDTITGCVQSGLTYAKGTVFAQVNQVLSTAEVTALSRQFLAGIQDQLTNALCFNDAQMHLVGADTQARQIERSRLDLSLAMLKLRNAQDTVPRLVAEGQRRVAAEGPVTSLVNDTWKDLWDVGVSTSTGAVEQARRDLHVARRATYLAVRAVEYEWQMSLNARVDVLRATGPAELDAVLTSLRTALAPNNIAGQVPKNANVVLSLKEHVLQLASMTAWPAGEKTWTDTERLRYLLTSPRLAHHDDGGAYLGQLVPFSIAPLGVLGLGRSGGIPLLTGSDCAERIWKVNLVLQGEGIVDGAASKTRVDLLQRNVFGSQWCTDPGAGVSALQSLSARPSRNLFQDPVWGRVTGSGGGAATAEADKFLRASVDAYHNVARADFETAAYEQGASMELAARGLYGDFALFFSKDLLAVDGHGGLHLEQLDDVLIRFDYVSVTKSW
ncbi:MAG TPA: EB domain-containing protein [Polyangia bacterium]|jgi:hypothetical protein